MIYSSFTNLLDYWEESESKLTTKIGPRWLSAGMGWGGGQGGQTQVGKLLSIWGWSLGRIETSVGYSGIKPTLQDITFLR